MESKETIKENKDTSDLPKKVEDSTQTDITYHDLNKAPNSNPDMTAKDYLQNFFGSNFETQQYKFADKSIQKKK